MLEQGYASSSLTTESPGLQVCRQLLSWTDFKNLCEELAGKIDWKKYQAIFPVIRGGVYPAVELSGIGLAADVELALKAELGADPAVHLVYLFFVPLEEVHEAGFGAGGAAAAQKFHGGEDVVQLLKV